MLDDMKKLMSLAAFWKNDKPNGVGVQLTYEIGNLDKMFEVLKDTYNLMWRQSCYESETAQLVEDLIGQLEAIGQTKSKLELEIALMAIGNVWLLEKIGELKPDEFNGCQIIYL